MLHSLEMGIANGTTWLIYFSRSFDQSVVVQQKQSLHCTYRHIYHNVYHTLASSCMWCHTERYILCCLLAVSSFLIINEWCTDNTVAADFDFTFQCQALVQRVQQGSWNLTTIAVVTYWELSVVELSHVPCLSGATLSMRSLVKEEPDWRTGIMAGDRAAIVGGPLRLRRGSRFTWRKECQSIMERWAGPHWTVLHSGDVGDWWATERSSLNKPFN